MRIIIRAVSLIFVFGLQSVCLGARAEKSTLDIAESVERYVVATQKQAQAQVEEALAEAKNEMARAQADLENEQKQMEAARDLIEREFKQREEARQPLVAPTPPSVKFYNNALSIITDKFGPERAENVLVIPAGEMAGEQLAEIIEDMNIMSRIFEKDLGQADMLKGSHIWFFGTKGAGTPRNIYLEGYGALFLMDVDFPLLPLPQAEEKETEEEDVDQVWQQAKREVLRSPDDRYFKIESEDEEEVYDAAKVEDLKTKLVRNLKHAANIRNLKSSEWIIVAVTGSGGESAEIHISTRYGRSGRGARAVGGGRGARGSGRGGRVGGGGRSAPGSIPPIPPMSPSMGRSGGGGFTGGLSTRSASATVLTVRAKKSDVDAFAKGKLDFKQFQKRVQMFTY